MTFGSGSNGCLGHGTFQDTDRVSSVCPYSRTLSHGIFFSAYYRRKFPRLRANADCKWLISLACRN